MHGLIEQIGSQPVIEDTPIRGSYAGVCAERPLADSLLNENRFLPRTELPALSAPAAGGDIVSATGEIRLNPTKGYLEIVTPRTECLVTNPIHELQGGLSARGIDTFCSVPLRRWTAIDCQTAREFFYFI